MIGPRRLSLLEVSVSLMLLIVVLGAVFGSMSVAHDSERLGRERQAATAAAHRALTELRAERTLELGQNIPAYAFHASLNTGAGRVDLRPASAGFEPLNILEPERAGHVFIRKDPDGNGSEDLLHLRIVVAWKNSLGGDERVELVSRRYP